MTTWATPSGKQLTHDLGLTDLVIDDLDHAAPFSAAFTYCG